MKSKLVAFVLQIIEVPYGESISVITVSRKMIGLKPLLSGLCKFLACMPPFRATFFYLHNDRAFMIGIYPDLLLTSHHWRKSSIHTNSTAICCGNVFSHFVNQFFHSWISGPTFILPWIFHHAYLIRIAIPPFGIPSPPLKRHFRFNRLKIVRQFCLLINGTWKECQPTKCAYFWINFLPLSLSYSFSHAIRQPHEQFVPIFFHPILIGIQEFRNLPKKHCSLLD